MRCSRSCLSRNRLGLVSAPGSRQVTVSHHWYYPIVGQNVTLLSLVCLQAFVAIGDYNGHVGLGVKCSKEVATAIRGAIILAKLSIVPVRRGYWGNKIGKPHTVPCKVTGRCGSVLVRLIPAPRGTGIVSAPVPKKLLMMAGIDDCYTSARGCTATLGNFGKVLAVIVGLNFSFLLALLSLTSTVVALSLSGDKETSIVMHGRKTICGLLCSPFSVLYTLHVRPFFFCVFELQLILFLYQQPRLPLMPSQRLTAT